jgi:exosortase H (IPTLxxWG-CTERM-specific)
MIRKGKSIKRSNQNSGLGKWYNKYPVVVFIGLFAFQIILFYLFYFNPRVQVNILTPLINLYADISSHILNLAGQKTSVSGDLIYSTRFSVAIKNGCDAVEPMALFVAGIIAYPSSIRKKLVGIFPGIITIFILNIIRVVALFLTGVYKQSLFELMHVEIWQMIFIMIAVGMWLLWLRQTSSKPSKT